MLEPLNRDIQVIMINISKELVEKVESMHEQMVNFSNDRNYIRQSSENVRKNMVSEMTSFDRLSNKLKSAKKRMTEL